MISGLPSALEITPVKRHATQFGSRRKQVQQKMEQLRERLVVVLKFIIKILLFHTT